MDSDAIIELEQLLREEREAIRQLDGARVLGYATRKESIIRGLQQGTTTLSAASAARLRALAPALRHNSVLLAHARDVLRDALVVARANIGGATLAPAGTGGSGPRILSVRG